jgi:acyl-CoA synthetase (NDP forming)
VARRVAKKKPIVALYVGGTEAGARAGASHTAVLSSPDAIYDGAFAQAGVLRASSFPEMFDWCWALAEQPVPAGKNMAIVTNSGGPGSSFADAASRLGLNVPELSTDTQDKLRAIIPGTASPRNPVDITFAVDMQNLMMDKVPSLLLKSPEVHGLLVYGLFTSEVFVKYAAGMGLELPIDGEKMKKFDRKMSRKFSETAREAGKPVVGATFFTRDDDELIRWIQDCGVPMLPSAERAASAMNALYRYGRIREKLANSESAWDK